MNPTEDKFKNLFQRNNVKTFEFLGNDERKYYPVKQLQDVNLVLQSSSKTGLIISGPSGTGKTALVHCFAKQNLQDIFGLKSIKIAKIKPMWLIGRPDIDKIIDQITAVITQAKTNELIIYAQFNDSEVLKKTVDVVSAYLQDIKTYYEMSFLKFIFECTQNDSKEFEELAQSLNSEWRQISCIQDKNIDLLVDMLIPRVDEFSELYGIQYTREILMFYLALEYSWNEEDNLSIYLDEIEKAFLLSKKSGKTALGKEVAKLMYPKSFKYLENTSKDALKNTARHEAGHTLLRLINNKKNDICFVSIIPGNNYKGVTVFDNSRSVASYYLDKEYFLNEIAGNLAGRIAENTLDKNMEPNAGASCDLRTAMQTLNDLVKCYGMSEVLGLNYVFTDKEEISNDMLAKIEEEKSKMLKKAEGIARDIVFKYSDFVEKLADRLCEDLVLVNHQVYELWEAYNNKKNEEEKQG